MPIDNTETPCQLLTGAINSLNDNAESFRAQDIQNQTKIIGDALDAMRQEIINTNTFAQNLIDRTTRVDSRLLEAMELERDCELGDIVRMRDQLTKNLKVFGLRGM